MRDSTIDQAFIKGGCIKGLGSFKQGCVSLILDYVNQNLTAKRFGNRQNVKEEKSTMAVLG